MASSSFDPFAADRPKPKPAKSEPVGSIHDQLQALIQEDFEWCLHDNPEWASQAGFHQHDGRLQDVSPQAFDLRKEHNEGVLAGLAKLDLKEGSVTDADRLQAQLFKAALTDESEAYDLGCHLRCINSMGMGGVFESFFELLDWMHFDNEEDIKKFLERLMAVPEQFNQWADLLAYGAMQKKPVSKSMFRDVPSRIQELMDSDLSMLRKRIEGVKDLDPEIKEQIDQAIHHCFKGGLSKFQTFINEFYSNRVMEEPGACALKNGKEFYACNLRFHTTTTKSAEELHQLGLSEVSRIEKRFQTEVMDVAGFTGSLTEFAEKLKQDPAFQYDTVADLLAGYRTLMDEITPLLPKYFPVIPKSPLEIAEMQNGPGAFYMAGTPDGKRPGRFFVNVSRLKERTKYEMMALALHEGIPGHHFQASSALENETLPNFMRYIEDRRYEMGAGRRPMYAAYMEGWALYCEHLGEEMGLYRTPEDLFGMLSAEMLRAVRLVVDTGIHEYGWSVEKAAEFMESKTGLHTAKCESECHRYAAWPGQACAYKVGQLAIEEMRSKAETALGKDFDLPSFHQVLIGSGPMPMTILDQHVDAWIQSKKSA